LATVGPICGKPPDAHVRVESKVHTGFGSPEVTIRSSTAESAGGGRRRSFSETIRGNKGKLPGPFVRQGGGRWGRSSGRGGRLYAAWWVWRGDHGGGGNLDVGAVGREENLPTRLCESSIVRKRSFVRNGWVIAAWWKILSTIELRGRANP
jgi:hypothetical protein